MKEINNTEELLQQLYNLNIISKNNQINKKADYLLKNKYPSLFLLILEKTSFLNYPAKTRDRLFCLINQITEQPKCQTCGKDMKFNHQKNRFNNFCPNTKNSSCGMNYKEKKQQIKNTLLKKYGVDNAMKNKEICLKQQKTMLKKYGVKRMVQLKEHCDNLKTLICKRKDQINEKRKNTMIAKYRRNTFAQTFLTDETYSILNNKEKLIDLLKDFSKTEIAEYLNVSFNLVHNYCKKHGIEYVQLKKSVSIPQQQLTKFILLNAKDQQISINVKTVIPTYDLDIFIPKLNLALEYNGIFFHGETKHRRKKYHLNKYMLCKQRDIRLIQIWSNEWLYKNLIVKSRLKSILKKIKKRIYARKCQIIEIDLKTAKQFLNQTHIQGYVNSHIHYGLMYQNQLVFVMTFVKSRFNKNFEWELLRFSSALDTVIVGGVSKLFKHFIKQQNPKSIISYCDLRWGASNIYEKLGFTLSHTTNPNYYYFKRNSNTNRIYTRTIFQKHKLNRKLQFFDPSLSEWNNMINNGYDRIWDCGNAVYIWKK